MRGTVWVALALILSGCDFVTQLFSDLPEFEPRASSPPTPLTTPQSATTAQMEAQVRQQINKVRQKQGLIALQNNEKLAQVARDYSREMAEKDFFSHTNPEGETMVQRVQARGIIFYLMLGENLFTCTNIP